MGNELAAVRSARLQVGVVCVALAAMASACARIGSSSDSVAGADSTTPDATTSSVTLVDGTSGDASTASGEIVANGVDSARVVVQLRNAQGHALHAWPVRIYLDHSGVSESADSIASDSLVSDVDGQVVATVRSTLAGPRTVRAFVEPGLGMPSIELRDAPTLRFVGDVSAISVATSELRVVGSSTALASGAFPTRFEARVQDALGNAIPDVEVRFAIGAGALGDDRLDRLDARTDLDGIARAELRARVPGSREVAAEVRLADGSFAPIGGVAVTFLGDALESGDHRALIGQSARFDTIDYRADDGAVVPRIQLGTYEPEPIHVVTARPRTRPYECLALTSTRTDLGTEVRARRWTGTVWAFDWSIPFVPLEAIEARGFALAYERAARVPEDGTRSDEQALAVYTDGYRTPRFRVFDGATWTTEGILPLNDGPGLSPNTNTGSVRWIELAARPDTEEIALGFVDTNGSLVVILWDGQEWRPETAIRLAADVCGDGAKGVAGAFRAFDLTYDGTGALHVAWGARNTAGTWHARRDAAGVWDVPFRFGSVPAHFVDLVAEDGADGAVARVSMQLDGAALAGSPRPAAFECAFRPAGQMWQTPFSSTTLSTLVEVRGSDPTAIAFVDGVATCFVGDGGLVRVERLSGGGWLQHAALPEFGNPVHIETHGGLDGRAFGVALTNEKGDLELGLRNTATISGWSPRTIVTGLPLGNRRAFGLFSR